MINLWGALCCGWGLAILTYQGRNEGGCAPSAERYIAKNE